VNGAVTGLPPNGASHVLRIWGKVNVIPGSFRTGSGMKPNTCLSDEAEQFQTDPGTAFGSPE
jgi:hypothetical protein